MALSDILTAPDADWVYLVEVTLPGGMRQWSHGRIVSPRFGETMRQFPPYLRNPLQTQTNINPLDVAGGIDGTSIGVIEVMWEPDLGIDDLGRELWEGAPIAVYLGLASYTRASFHLLFSGMVEGITFDDASIKIVTRTAGWKLDANIQANEYAGNDTAYEGSASLKGVPKPIGIGIVYNATAVCVDYPGAYNWVYQINDGPISSITAVVDRGGPALTHEDDVSTSPHSPVGDWNAPGTSLENWIPRAGQYVTDLARGLFRLATAPLGVVTCGFVGVSNDADASLGIPLKCKDV